MPKQVNIEKIKSEFEKADLDEQINAYHIIKEWITSKLIERTTELENEKEKYFIIKDQL